MTRYAVDKLLNNSTRSSDRTDRHQPTAFRAAPRDRRFRVVCNECAHVFSTSDLIPECSACHGSDVEVR